MKTAKLAHTLSTLTLAAASYAMPLAASAGFVVATGATLTACADENDPKTWVKRLDDPAQRGPAVKRLQQFFEDGMTNANKNREDPKVKALLDDIVEPLTKQYTGGTIADEKTRKDLIKFLADTNDPRTAPALAKALKDYEPKKNEEDVKFAAQATKTLANAGKLTDQGLIDALWECFSKFRASQTNSINLVTEIHDAVLAVKHPSYGPKAVEKLAAPVDPKSPDSMRDQVQFWQMTAIQVIGELKFGAAAKPLVVTLLSPTKGDLRATVRTALLRMPKEAEGPLLAALKGTDPDLAKLASEYPEKAYVAVLSESIAYISRNAGRDAIVDALGAADNDQNRTVLAMNLVHFPAEQKTQDAYLAAYNKIDPKAGIALMGGGNGRGILLQASSHFYDAKLVDWIVKEKNAAKGDQADEISPGAIDAMIKLMKADQLKTVGIVVGQLTGPATEKDKYNAASKVVEKCKEDASCYAKVLDEPIPSSPETAKMGAIKACWMAAMVGNEGTRKELLGKVDKIKDGGVRLALVEAIDHLAPKGDVAAADALDKIVDADRASGNKLLMQADDAVAKVSLKLRSRATQ
jgi:hypothetical protein